LLAAAATIIYTLIMISIQAPLFARHGNEVNGINFSLNTNIREPRSGMGVGSSKLLVLLLVNNTNEFQSTKARAKLVFCKLIKFCCCFSINYKKNFLGKA